MLYFDGLLNVLKDSAVFERALDARLEIAARRARKGQDAIAAVCRARDIDEALNEGLVARWSGRQSGARLANLRHLALVVTKSDRFPIVHPPVDYPRLKLPSCATHIGPLRAYLRLLGGDLRCYNATAIGYAVQRGDRWQPGPGNSFTPVNIVEPIFDMLLGEGEA